MIGLDRCARWQDKLACWDDLLLMRQQARDSNRRVVWTNGCFDLLHIGHIRSLQAAHRLGDILVVGVNGDDSVRRLKGPTRPIFSSSQRAEMLAALECVDYVVVFHESTPATCLARLQPDIHCKGAEYAPPHGRPIPEADIVLSYGGRIEFLPLVPAVSTSEIVRAIHAQAKTANPAESQL
jgi:D-glycero-beta-D-manno-heptose 1-phosphate adenylyltransferase